MQSLNNLDVVRQMAREHATELRRTTDQRGSRTSRPAVRRWVGQQLVHLGAWVAAEPTMRQITAR